MISEIANSLFLTYLASEYIVSSPSSSSSSCSSRTRRTSSGNNCSRTLTRPDDDNNINNNNSNKNTNDTYDSNINWNILGSLTCLVAIANLLDYYYLILPSLFETISNATKTINNINIIHSYYFTVPMKICSAATSYVVALYVDVHRQRNNKRKHTANNKRNRKKIIPFKSVFLPKVGWTFMKILPAYPFLAVLISFLFLFVVDLWEYIFHLPLEWLNKPIYYGTLYGPFAAVYVYVKKEMLVTFSRDDNREQVKYECDHGIDIIEP